MVRFGTPHAESRVKSGLGEELFCWASVGHSRSNLKEATCQV